jgi:hypothetical protein
MCLVIKHTGRESFRQDRPESGSDQHQDGNAFGCRVLSFARRVLRINDVTIEHIEIVSAAIIEPPTRDQPPGHEDKNRFPRYFANMRTIGGEY